MPVQIAPSVLAADFLDLRKDIELINEHADVIHLDVMDGHFVPNISFGFPVIRSISTIARKPMDVHLMVTDPEEWFDELQAIGVRMVSFHLEAAKCYSMKLINKLHDMGMKAGIVIRPDTPVRKLFPFIGKADYFLIMSVYPGFGGQKFIYESLDRISELKAEIEKRGESAIIEIDGGVDLSNIGAIREAGADLIVAGSTVFNSEDPAATILLLSRH